MSTTHNSAQTKTMTPSTTSLPPPDISSSYLEAIGYKKIGVHLPEGSQSVVVTYIKNKSKITYDGTNWVLNDSQTIKNFNEVPL